MKKTAISLFVIATLALNAAQMTTTQTPLIAENDAIMRELFTGIDDSGASSTWGTTRLNMSEVFGVDFDSGKYDVRVVALSTNFGIQGQNLGVFNAYGVEGSMTQVPDGYRSYEGQESFISYAEGEAPSFLAYSALLDKTYNLMDNSNGIFGWEETSVSTWYYETDADGVVQLKQSDLKTLLVGFEDSNGIWDWDHNDLIWAVQIVEKDQAGLASKYTSQPSGQPLPGVLACLFAAAIALPAYARIKKGKAKA